jgi:hypothetical protein
MIETFRWVDGTARYWHELTAAGDGEGNVVDDDSR